MLQLTKKENKIYTQLVREYNDNGWQKICSIGTFIRNKWENEKNIDKASTYYQIWFFACEDF